MNSGLIRGCLGVFLLAVMALAGCDKDKDSTRQERQQMQEQVRRLEHQRDQDRRVFQALTQEAQSDAAAAMVMWIASSAGLLVVILLLARERHIRAVLQGLVGRLLGRHRPRGP